LFIALIFQQQKQRIVEFDDGREGGVKLDIGSRSIGFGSTIGSAFIGFAPAPKEPPILAMRPAPATVNTLIKYDSPSGVTDDSDRLKELLNEKRAKCHYD
jgi:hypothetical protein